MNPIRPSVLPPTPQGSSPQDSAKLAAQRAFFAAAMGQAPAATIQPTSPAATTAARAAPAPAEAPQKILRPGSLIDIRV